MREIRFQRNGSLHTAVNRQRPKSSLGSEGGVDGSIFYIYPRQWERGSGADMQKRRRAVSRHAFAFQYRFKNPYRAHRPKTDQQRKQRKQKNRR